MLARLLATEVAGGGPEADWVILLRSCSAHEAFLRTYRREPNPALAAEFLLLDRLFPRSVFCALSAAEERLRELDPVFGRAGTHDDWAAYDQAMVDEQRTAVFVAPTRIYGNPPQV